MIRILFLVIWIILFFSGLAQAGIEIYVNGHKYDSLQAYQASKKTALAGSQPIPATLNGQQEDYIRKEAQELGIDVDFSKVKTFQLSPPKLSDAALHRLYVMSVEKGVVGALKGFYKAWGQSDFELPRRISSEQLQEVIRQEVTTSKNPKLLISTPGKVRIMSLSPDNSTE